jgi:hypothetical protein
LPQVPQLDVSVAVITHDPMQFVLPAGHPSTHAALAHTMVPVQAMLHMLQWSMSVWRLTHSPLQNV